MASLRQYASKEFINAVTGGAVALADATDANINLAESIIDDFCYREVDPALRPFYFIDEFVTADFTTTNCIVDLPNLGGPDFYQYCNIEILEGPLNGLIIPITSSTGTTLNFDAVAALGGSLKAKIYQLGKFPRRCDCSIDNNEVYKSIPREIREAVAYQVEFYLEQQESSTNVFLSGFGLKKESISETYSYEIGDKDNLGVSTSSYRLLAPKAVSLLKRFMKR